MNPISAHNIINRILRIVGDIIYGISVSNRYNIIVGQPNQIPAVRYRKNAVSQLEIFRPKPFLRIKTVQLPANLFPLVLQEAPVLRPVFPPFLKLYPTNLVFSVRCFSKHFSIRPHSSRQGSFHRCRLSCLLLAVSHIAASRHSYRRHRNRRCRRNYQLQLCCRYSSFCSRSCYSCRRLSCASSGGCRCTGRSFNNSFCRPSGYSLGCTSGRRACPKGKSGANKTPHQRHLLRRHRRSRKHLTQGQHNDRGRNHMETAAHFSLLPENLLFHRFSGIVQTAFDGSFAALGQTGYLRDSHFIHVVGNHRCPLQYRQAFYYFFYNLYCFLPIQGFLRQPVLIPLRQRLKLPFFILSQKYLMSSPQLLTAQVKGDSGDPFPKIPAVLEPTQAPVGSQKGILYQIQRLLIALCNCFRVKIDQTVGLLIKSFKSLLIPFFRLFYQIFQLHGSFAAHPGTSFAFFILRTCNGSLHFFSIIIS